VQLWFEYMFSFWADIVSKRTTVIFIVSFLIQVGLSCGFLFFENHYKDQTLLWTPRKSPTLDAYDQSKSLFPDENKIRTINLIVEAKGDTLLTREVFNEMI